MAQAVLGLKAALPDCDIELLHGFEAIDLAHQPTQAAFKDPQNAGLERIAAWAQSTGTSLRSWYVFREPTERERREKPRSFYSFTHESAGPLEYAADAMFFSDAAARLLQHVNDDARGFDMVCGFSQGGEVALMLASRAHEFRHLKRRPYRFALFGSELPLVLSLAPTLSFVRASAAPSKPPNAVAVFAVMGEQVRAPCMLNRSQHCHECVTAVHTEGRTDRRVAHHRRRTTQTGPASRTR